MTLYGLGWQIQRLEENYNVQQQTHFGHYYNKCMIINGRLKDIIYPPQTEVKS
jgi:hypothetical protein